MLYFCGIALGGADEDTPRVLEFNLILTHLR